VARNDAEGVRGCTVLTLFKSFLAAAGLVILFLKFLKFLNVLFYKPAKPPGEGDKRWWWWV
jgi:hypothetical protein